MSTNVVATQRVGTVIHSVKLTVLTSIFFFKSFRYPVAEFKSIYNVDSLRMRPIVRSPSCWVENVSTLTVAPVAADSFCYFGAKFNQFIVIMRSFCISLPSIREQNN